MPLKFTPLLLSVSLASPMLSVHNSSLAEPPHTHELPRFPGQTVSVSSPAVSGSNVTSQTVALDAQIAGADLVLPLDGLRAAIDRRGADTEYSAHLRSGIASVPRTANLCIVYTGAGTAYVLAVPFGVAGNRKGPAL